MDAKAETWCDRDEHKLFEYYVDFNEWLDSDDAASAIQGVRILPGIPGTPYSRNSGDTILN